MNGRPYAIPVIHPDEVAEPADLVLVALKHHHLPEALQDIKSLVGDDTVILSVMNGLESEEIIGSVCGFEKTVYAIAVGIDAVNEKHPCGTDSSTAHTTPVSDAGAAEEGSPRSRR